MIMFIIAHVLFLLMCMCLVVGIIAVCRGIILTKPLTMVYGGFMIGISKYMIGELAMAITDISARMV